MPLIGWLIKREAMAKDKFANYERIEMIPPSKLFLRVPWEEGDPRDTVLAASTIPETQEDIYVIRRLQPKSEYGRRSPPTFILEIHQMNSTRVKRMHQLIIEEAYIEWRDAQRQLVDFESAFPGHPELLALNENPKEYYRGGFHSYVPRKLKIYVCPTCHLRFWTLDDLRDHRKDKHQWISSQNPINPVNHDKVAYAFAHRRSAEGYNAHSDGRRLTSYQTTVMEWTDGGKLIENATGYSSQTTQLMSAALQYVSPDYYAYAVPMGTRDLVQQLKEQTVIATSQVGPETVNLIRAGRDKYPSYFLEFLDRKGNILRHEEVPDTNKTFIPKKAYLEYMDADQCLVPFNEAFPGHLDLAAMKRKHPGTHRLTAAETVELPAPEPPKLTPAAQELIDAIREEGRQADQVKRMFGYPQKNPNPVVGKNQYFLPHGLWHKISTKWLAQSYVQHKGSIEEIDLFKTSNNRYFIERGLRLGMISPPWIYKYISKLKAIREWRDADTRFATYAEAFQ
jgi:hypothetical protein